MEFVVGALAVLGLVAIVARFSPRDASGELQLPRIIDDSIGMWALRRLTGRPTDPAVDPFARFRRPSTVLGRRPDAAARLRARPAEPVVPRAIPTVLRGASEAASDAPLPPAWTTIERRPLDDRPFGSSIRVIPAPPPARWRPRAALQIVALTVCVALGGLAIGAVAGMVSGPAPSDASIPAASPALRADSPAGSPRPSSR